MHEYFSKSIQRGNTSYFSFIQAHSYECTEDTVQGMDCRSIPLAVAGVCVCVPLRAELAAQDQE